eukprot:jgi/Ulvmu1/4276/UM197_0003.1
MHSGRVWHSGRQMHPQRSAFEGFLRPDSPGIHSQHAALRFLSALQNQSQYRRGGIQEVLWELMKAAVASGNRRPWAADPASSGDSSSTVLALPQGAAGISGSDFGVADADSLKAPGLARVEEFLRVAASAGSHGQDTGVEQMVLPLLRVVLEGGGPQMIQDRAVAEVLMQVYKAPYIMDMLCRHVTQHGVCACIVEFLAALACSRNIYGRNSIMEDNRILAMVKAATDNRGVDAPAGSSKLQALYAASGPMRRAAAIGRFSCPAEVVQTWPGGRHDNDREDFRAIAVVPTPNEIAPTAAPPYLPQADGSDNFLAWELQTRGVDRNFRLFREDQIAGIREVLVAVDNPGHDGPKPILFHNACIEDVGFSRGDSPHFKLSMDIPRRIRETRPADLEHFWQRSKWLLHGAILCIRQYSTRGTQRSHLVEVAARDPKELAHQCRNHQRISVGVRFCHPDANLHGLDLVTMSHGGAQAQTHASHAPQAAQSWGDKAPADGDPRAAAAAAAAARAATAQAPSAVAAGADRAHAEEAENVPAARMTAVQVAHDFAVARPVLEALQEERLVTPPFGKTLFAEERPPPALPVAPPLWENDPVASAYLQHRVEGLDHAQREAFDQALRREVALIQGPPGTGKTYVAINVARALLAHRANRLLIVTYTNHALDQILEAILDSGLEEESLLRIGGRCENERIEKLGLFALMREQNKPGAERPYMAPAEKARNFALKTEIELMKEQFTAQTVELKGIPWLSPTDVPLLVVEDEIEVEVGASTFLPHGYMHGIPHAFGGDSDDDGDDGFVQVRQRRRIGRDCLWRLWLQGLPPTDRRVAPWLQQQHNHAVWCMPKNGRLILACRWIKRTKQARLAQLCELWRKLDKAVTERADLNAKVKVRSHAETKLLVGCTTSGAAKYRAMMSSIPFTAVLVEEAAEIVEAHVIAALPATARRLIMIGDHKQLRPKVNQYGLQVQSGKGHDLNVSLFERLIQERLPLTSLQTQHRMRPEISSPVRLLTYPNLQDHARTHGRAPLRGVGSTAAAISQQLARTANSAFLVAHAWPEKDDKGAGVAALDSKSRVNIPEAAMVVKVLRYVLQQGYGGGEVVVLTPYLGQLRVLREYMRRDGIQDLADERDEDDMERLGLAIDAGLPDGGKGVAVRASTVDNFQGEEARIVIASLTRSKANGKIGFLNEPQRVNVLLSRARDALILIGNPRCLLGRTATVQDTDQELRYRLGGKTVSHRE